MLASLDRVLPPGDRAACEGDPGSEGVGVAELHAALLQCASGKTPGTDGLTYEFYRAFWPQLGGPLAACLNAAFALGDEGRLTDSQLLGQVVLVYKGSKAGPRSQVASYRPLTMLNSDYKLMAKVLALRFARPLCSVIDPTQTAFLPDRWIGDNVLQHLEEIDYLEVTRNPGVLAFIDFEKAYDRISRPWVEACMEGQGFGPRAVRWVRLLHRGTRARCRFNGFHTRDFAVRSGVAQGSPLSPALYLIAAQPLASSLRALQRAGALGGILLPDGTLAPPSTQHADDTTLHLSSLADLAVAQHRAILPYCRASASLAHAVKTRAMLLGAAADGRHGGFTDPDSGVEVVPRGLAVRHLGLMLGPGDVGVAARAAKYATLEAVVRARISHWSAYALSPDGRAHVARQCLGSTLVYHAAFSRPPPDLLARLTVRVMAFVDGGDAVGAPPRAIAQLPRALGGRGVISIPRVVDALQAGVVVRLLHPARLPWKILMASWLGRLPPPAPSFGLRALLFAGGPGPGLPSRVAGYVDGFWACTPHRSIPVEHLSPASALAEPLLCNPSVVDGGLPLAPLAFPAALAAGVQAVADLAAALLRQPPPSGPLAAELRTLRSSLPPSWGRLLSPPPPPSPSPPPQEPPVWFEWPRATGPLQMVRVGGGGEAEVYDVGPDGALAAVGAAAAWPPPPWRPADRLCLVVATSTRAARRPAPAEAGAASGSAAGGGTASPLPAPARLYVVGPCAAGAAAPLDPTLWAVAGEPLLRSTAQRRTQHLVQRDAAASGGGAGGWAFRPGQPLQPAVWPSEAGTGLAAAEQRWRDGSRKRTRMERDQPDPGMWQYIATAQGLRGGGAPAPS